MNDEQLNELDAQVARLRGWSQGRPPTPATPQFALPLIESNLKSVMPLDDGEWYVQIRSDNVFDIDATGPTLAIAVCRAVVARGKRG